MTALKPYPAYKASGAEWLGEVPSHWEVRQLGRVGRFSKGSGGTKKDQSEHGIPCIRYGDLYTQHQFFITESRTFVTRRLAATYTPVRYGDVLFAGSGETTDEIGKSAVNLIRGPACCGGDVIIFRPSIDVDARFLGYATDCPQAVYQKACMGRGITVMHIYWSSLKYMAVAFPPLLEQATIIHFLDDADRRIRRYIREKQKLIKLLEEQKQAIIYRAVTRGLDPNVRLKPSGIEWLGKVPEHWKMFRNGQLFSQRNEKGFPELPILEVSLKTGVRIRDMENPDRKQMMAVRSEYKRAVKGDIAYNMMRMWQGAVGVAPVDGLVSPAYVVANRRRGTDPRYFSALFRTRSYMDEVNKYSRGIVKDRNRLYWEDFKQMPTPCPPPDEQVRIADAVDHIVATIGDRLQHIRRQIELLREYRTRLIADVVTGNLDVREADVQLPDEAHDQKAVHSEDMSPGQDHGGLRVINPLAGLE